MGSTHDLRYVESLVDLWADAPKRALRPQQLVGTPDDPGGIDGHERIFLRPGVVEQAADNSVETLELAGYAIGDFRIHAAAPQYFQIRSGGAEWVAHFVRDPRREPPDARELL